MSATALKRTSSPVFYCEQINGLNITFFGSFHSIIRSDMFYKIGLFKNFGKLTGKGLLPEFLSDKVVHHQAYFFWFISVKHPLGYVLQNRSLQKFRKTYRKTPLPEFLSDKVVHHQTCNFIKKRLWLRCFTEDFAKLFQAPFLQNSFFLFTLFILGIKFNAPL